MKRVQVQRRVRKQRSRLEEALPLDPRDPEVVRAKRLSRASSRRSERRRQGS
ncbi:MAG TPA: hypothetical protein VNO34_01095 [Actinomycetota bacterium]|nr:hypothetical protein [Actinomycetota bacterium]